MSWWLNTGIPDRRPSGERVDIQGAGQVDRRWSGTKSPTTGAGQVDRRPQTSPIDEAYERQMAEIERLGGRSTLQQLIGQQMQYQQPMAQQMPGNAPPTVEEFTASILGQLGGGGGVDLSGYNALLEDIASREAALGGRREENLAGIQSLYENAAAAREEDIAALQESIEAQIQGDMERQASQEANRRAAEAERFGTASEARAALGADVGTSDLVGQTVEQSLGRLAERALTGQQNVQNLGQIGQQRIQAEKSGYTSAQELATRALSNAYEDRLAQLASERAATQAQIAQARAAARPRGPSISDILGIRSAYQAEYGEQPMEPLDVPGLTGIAYQYYPIAGEQGLELAKKFAQYAASVGYGGGYEGQMYFDPGTLTERMLEQYPELENISDIVFAMAQEYASG